MEWLAEWDQPKYYFHEIPVIRGRTHGLILQAVREAQINHTGAINNKEWPKWEVIVRANTYYFARQMASIIMGISPEHIKLTLRSGNIGTIERNPNLQSNQYFPK